MEGGIELSVTTGSSAYDKVYASEIIGVTRAINLIYHWSLPASKYVVGTVLDLGCGLGLMADLVSGEYTGIDYSQVAIWHAKAHVQNQAARFTCDDLLLYVLDAGDDSVDTVILCEVLEHLKHPEDTIREAKRVARDRIVMTVPRNSPNPLHVKSKWSYQDMLKLLGPKSTIENIRGFWLGIWFKDGRPNMLARPCNCNDK